MDGSGTSFAEPRSPTTEKPAPDNKTGPQAELLHQVNFMSNPIHLKQVLILSLWNKKYIYNQHLCAGILKL